MSEEEKQHNQDDFLEFVKKKTIDAIIKIVIGGVASLILCMIVFYFTTSAEIKANTNDIKRIENKVDQKADLQTVIRIKADNDRIQQIILDDIKDVKLQNTQIYNLLVEHMNSSK